MFGRMSAMPLVRLDAGKELEIAVAELLAATDYPEIARWIQFPRGLMLFLLVPGDTGSGAVYVYDRCDGIWCWVDFQDQKKSHHSAACWPQPKADSSLRYATLRMTCHPEHSEGSAFLRARRRSSRLVRQRARSAQSFALSLFSVVNQVGVAPWPWLRLRSGWRRSWTPWNPVSIPDFRFKISIS